MSTRIVGKDSMKCHCRAKNLGGYHNLHVYSNKLLLVDGFENFSSKCIVSYELDPAYLFSAL